MPLRYLFDRALSAMKQQPIEGCFVEFGVYQGCTLGWIKEIAAELHSSDVYGFDSFCGMPATQVELKGQLAVDWAPGTFSNTSISIVRERLPDVRLVAGIFADLRPLNEYGVGKVRFAHIDVDIYEGYRDALRLLTPHIQRGTILLFDEAVDPGWFESIRDHGARAIEEWQSTSGFRLSWIDREWTIGLAEVTSSERSHEDV